MLDRILERCREAEIECVLVESPVTSYHRDVLGGDIQRTFTQALDGARTRHPVEFLDLSARMPDDAFRDSTHGNPDGAARFSAIVADEVIAPRWPPR